MNLFKSLFLSSLIGICFLLSCIEIKEKACISNYEKQKMIEAIFKTPDFQMFLHPNVKGRLPVKLVKNEFVTEDLKLISNGLPVELKDSLSLPYGNVHRLRVIEMDCEKQSFSYSIFYPVEGAIITGVATKADSVWSITNTNWGIKD